jgi:hypothetical protein
MPTRTALFRTYHPSGFVATTQTVTLLRDNYSTRTVIGQRGKHAGKSKIVRGDLISVDCQTADGELLTCPIENLSFTTRKHTHHD